MVKSVTLYRENVQWYFREINSKNMYDENVKNKEIMSIWLEGFMMYL
jgi:hypothetical protein